MPLLLPAGSGLNKFNPQQQAMKQKDRFKSRYADSFEVTLRFSRKSNIKSLATTDLYFQLQPLQLAVQVVLDRGLADAFRQLADRRADLHTCKLLSHDRSSPRPSSVWAASRKSRSVGRPPP